MARSQVRQLNRESPLFALIKFGKKFKQIITLVNEMADDHATNKAVVDELKTWAQTLATKLNADAGVTDTNYDTTITNSGPATLSASKVDDIDGDVTD